MILTEIHFNIVRYDSYDSDKTTSARSVMISQGLLQCIDDKSNERPISATTFSGKKTRKCANMASQQVVCIALRQTDKKRITNTTKRASQLDWWIIVIYDAVGGNNDDNLRDFVRSMF